MQTESQLQQMLQMENYKNNPMDNMQLKQGKPRCSSLDR